jgi:endo-beta-N-acetylglucosaminidase D
MTQKGKQKVTLYSSKFCFTKEAMMVAYQAKKTKVVYMLYTLYDVPKVAVEDAKKRPKLYSFTTRKKVVSTMRIKC